MFPNPVTVTPVTYSQDAAGGRVKTWPAELAVNLQASVQLIDPLRRGAYQGATVSEADGIALFAADPGVKADYRLVWHLPNLDRSFGVLGPATPEAGYTSLYSVMIREIK